MFSCSVLEDRTECKTHFVLNVDHDKSRLPEGAFELYIWKDGVFLRKEKMPCSLKNHKYDLSLESGDYEFLGISCLSDEQKSEDGHKVYLSEKGQYAEFYAFKLSAFIGEEDVEMRATLSKQFVRMTIRLYNIPYKQYSVSLAGGLSGVNLRTLEPIEREFTHSWPIQTTVYNLVLSRQIADSRLFFCVKNTGGTKVEDYEADLMEYIRRENYNWEDDELLDIDMSIDITNRLTIVQFKK